MSSLWESLHQTSWAKIKGDEQDYVMRSANDEDVEMRDVGDESDDDEEVQAALDPDEGMSCSYMDFLSLTFLRTK